MKLQWNDEWIRGWKAWWKNLFLRIDSLTLRERVFLFLSVLACCVAIVNLVWLSPAQEAYTQSVQRFDNQNSQLQRDRDALKLAARPEEASRGVRGDIADVKSRLQTVNRSIDEALPTTRETTSLDQALVHLLRQHKGLMLLRTAVSAPEKPEKATAEVALGTEKSAPVVGLTTQSVALTVSGSYSELVAYVQSLEKALPSVRWEGMALKSAAEGKGPTELTLKLSLMVIRP